ncbi:MAG: DUF3489 domain-containing protein [Pseudomonadota bacterium]
MAKTTRKKTATKGDQLVRILKAKAGADVVALGDKLGWQPHTTRAAISRLRKAGHEINVTKPNGRGVSTYRIIGTTSKQPASEVQNAG